MPRVVQFDEFGSRDYLRVVDKPKPWPGPGQILVRVMAAGLNLLDAKVYRDEKVAARVGVTVPSGTGQEFAGFVEEVGEGVTTFSVGEAVFGTAPYASIADFAVAAEGAVFHKPDALTFEVAGSLTIAGRTAMASVASLGLTENDTVLVSAAAGGVGVLAAQLAVRAGATVIATASEPNHDYLETLGLIPVAYGDGLADRVREVLDDGDTVTAVLDNHGSDTIEAAIELGVPVERINTIAAYGPEAHGATSVGGANATGDDVEEIARLLAENELVLPIDSIYPIERVGEAYGRLEAGHLRGKIVIVTE
ncbi:NADP-dependent oxidoreductase [Leifsonia sp. NPDC058292]|uniref:NADP-dependent oxidoreductase n=1 Tax=Leifsonia sp. NPDC058292 TaxID=3346428 RepID=UPI0036DE2022